MSCWEYKRQKLEEKKQMVNRLDSYFNALDNDKLDEYHKQHGRMKK